MSDSEYDLDSDQEISENHRKLVDDVRQLDRGQRVKRHIIEEPNPESSNFTLVKTDASDKGFTVPEIKSTVLPKAFEKPAAERIKRVVGFENTKKELGKWSGIIARNRTAASVSFPISQSSMKLESTDTLVKRFRIQSELEKKLAEVDGPKEAEEEDKDQFHLTLAEILERRKEAAKFRAQESYKAAKALRQNKIKSKKYHRIQRKEKIKKALKEFEELQKTDPQAALEKLEQLDRTRAEERMTLRHKSTGQWAKSKQVRAKYDKESRQVLAEQLAISRELTQKVKKDDDSDDDDDENQPISLSSTDKENPWLNGAKTESEIDNFISGYRKFWDEKNKSKKEKKATENGEDDAAKNKKVFEEPEIKGITKNRNPVEGVIEEYLPGQNGYSDHDSGVSEDEETSNKQSRRRQKIKLQKASKDKLGIKSPKTKVAKIKPKVKAGTSSWSISPVDSAVENNLNDTKEFDIDDLFDSAEDKLQEKMNRKLAKVQRMLERVTKNEKKKGRRIKKFDETNDVEKLGLKGQQNLKPIINKPMEESASARPSDDNPEIAKFTSITDFNKEMTKPKTNEIDPNKFMHMKPKHANTALPDEVGGENGALDDSEGEEDQHQIISEAFADDDVVDEFRKEKEDEIKKSLPEDVDMRLPGWGSWGGKDLKLPSRKRKRFIVKFPKEAPRRDENKGDVVIIEEKCPKIKKHLVSELPFPFTSVQDYEASMRAPIGRDFVPEKTFSKLITPAIKTKMGKIIEPMTDDVLVKTANLKKRKKPEPKEEPKGKKQKRAGGKGNAAKKGQQSAKKTVKSG